MHVLITGGGCEEPIDGVRYLANFSTGKTAAFLADYFASRHHEVTALMAARATRPSAPVRLLGFRSFSDLSDTLQGLLGREDFDLVIHAAAVSDFSPESIVVNGVSSPAGPAGKIESGAEAFIRLRENPKLIDSLKVWSRNERCSIVGFKLTNGAGGLDREEAVRALLKRSRADLVVSNDLLEISGDAHPFACYALTCDGSFALSGCGRTKNDLANFLETQCAERMRKTIKEQYI
jgi:phosphopantothenoylcysteine synthetase/decarboxylase